MAAFKPDSVCSKGPILAKKLLGVSIVNLSPFLTPNVQEWKGIATVTKGCSLSTTMLSEQLSL